MLGPVAFVGDAERGNFFNPRAPNAWDRNQPPCSVRGERRGLPSWKGIAYGAFPICISIFVLYSLFRELLLRISV